VVGVLQSGTVLYVRGVSHSGERRLIYQTLRELTGEKIGDSAKDWKVWASKN
jgi:hypothetical protein